MQKLRIEVESENDVGLLVALLESHKFIVKKVERGFPLKSGKVRLWGLIEEFEDED